MGGGVYLWTWEKFPLCPPNPMHMYIRDSLNNWFYSIYLTLNFVFSVFEVSVALTQMYLFVRVWHSWMLSP